MQGKTHKEWVYFKIKTEYLHVNIEANDKSFVENEMALKDLKRANSKSMRNEIHILDSYLHYPNFVCIKCSQ